MLAALSKDLLLIWIEGSDDHTVELIRRFDANPKPMYYNPEILRSLWAKFLNDSGVSEAKVDPDEFIRWAYAQALAHRQPRYAAMAKNWGVTVSADAVAGLRDLKGFDNLVTGALENAAAAA